MVAVATAVHTVNVDAPLCCLATPLMVFAEVNSLQTIRDPGYQILARIGRI